MRVRQIRKENTHEVKNMIKMVKKFFGLAVLALFVLSLMPGALARVETEGWTETQEEYGDSYQGSNGYEENSQYSGENYQGYTESYTEDEADEHVAEAYRNGFIERKEEYKERKEEFREDFAERRDELREVAKARVYDRGETFEIKDKEKFRLEAREKLEDMKFKTRERYMEIKEKHQEAWNDYKQKRNDLIQANREARGCTDDCEEKKYELKRGVRIHLVKTTDVIERSLEKLTNRVVASKTLTDEEKEDALTRIAELEDRLTSEKEKVETLAEDASSDDLRNAIQELKKIWQDIRKEQRRIIASLTASKLDVLTDKHDNFLEVMEKKISVMQEKGIDTTELEELQRKFEAQKAEVEASNAEAQKAWEEAKSSGSMEEFRLAQEYAREEMKESKDILREFMVEISTTKTG